MTDRYEHAVYEDDARMLTRAILQTCDVAMAIPDKRIRAAIISAALMSAAQIIDGNEITDLSIKPDGVAALLALCVDKARGR